MKRILYISYDGMTDPLGESQVLSYLEKLALGNNISLISFEKKDRFNEQYHRISQKCKEAGIRWHPLMYTKKPPVLSTVYDILRMKAVVKRLNKKSGFDIVHCRGYISSIVGFWLRKNFGVKFIFDMRGFWVDEKVESGSWRESNFLYRLVISYLRRKEKIFIEKSDAIVVLTTAAQKILCDNNPDLSRKIHVIPTCVNLSVFSEFDPAIRAIIRTKLDVQDDEFLLVYSGGFGGNYDSQVTRNILHAIKKYFPAKLLVLSKDGVTGFEQDRDMKVLSLKLPFYEVGKYLMAGDLGIINYKNQFSVAGRSPTKLGEYWASGLPAIAPRGIGDVDFLFAKYDRGGILLDETITKEQIEHIQTLPKSKLRSYAFDYFDLQRGISEYQFIYKKIAK